MVAQPTAGTLGNRGLRSHTELDGHGAYIPVAFSQNQREEVREVEVPGALAAEPGPHQQTYIAQPVPFTKSKRAQSVTDDETWVDGQVNPTLSLFDQGDTRATTVAVAFHPLQDPISSTDGSTHCMGTGSSRGDATIAVAVAPSQRCNTPAVAFKRNGGKARSDALCEEMSPTLGSDAGGNTVPSVAHALRGEGFDASEDGTGGGTPLIPQAMTVRRLTPRECERLQGFPDDYTLIPWRKKQAEDCPDGPRYKALGNSMACNCMAWIGERIAKWEAEHER
jgi:DNA (cytosine-5)-methyltransferase 1